MATGPLSVMRSRRRGSFVVPDLSLAMPHDAPDQRASSGEGAERAVVPTSATNNDAHMTSETTSLQSAGTSPPSIPEHEGQGLAVESHALANPRPVGKAKGQSEPPYIGCYT